ncbi:DUF983 domain-containing protein [Chitinophaga defluvii]|uniref:DUF983 domain-containing protein n=1 Tax=Chitinophaga defluvii TaxID=3163343 RepID=A0ABV2T4P9_9BACT
MKVPDEIQKPNLLGSVLQNKCPRCRRGQLFTDKNPYHLKKCLEMNEHCPVCGQVTEVEAGFYFGTGYVSYALSIATCVASFIAWVVFVGISIYDNRLFWWLGFNAGLLLLLQPIFMRLARSIWIYFFVPYDPNWQKPAVTPTPAVGLN